MTWCLHLHLSQAKVKVKVNWCHRTHRDGGRFVDGHYVTVLVYDSEWLCSDRWLVTMHSVDQQVIVLQYGLHGSNLGIDWKRKTKQISYVHTICVRNMIMCIAHYIRSCNNLVMHTCSIELTCHFASSDSSLLW